MAERCVAFKTAGRLRAKQPISTTNVQLHFQKKFSPLFSCAVKHEMAPNHPLTRLFEHVPLCSSRVRGWGAASTGSAVPIIPNK